MLWSGATTCNSLPPSRRHCSKHPCDKVALALSQAEILSPWRLPLHLRWLLHALHSQDPAQLYSDRPPH